MTGHRHVILTSIALAIMGCPPAFNADWPAFRGPDGSGKSVETSAVTEWGKEKNIRWKAALPAPGNGSPIVSGGRVFVTCAEDVKGLRRSLYCFDRETGDKLWVNTVVFNRQMPTHKTNPYCAGTPVSDGKRVVVWHGSAGLFCYSHDGKELWSRQLGEFRHMWGYASSPVLYKDRVILNAGPGKNVFMAAFSLDSGEVLWQTTEAVEGNGERNLKNKYQGSWCTPLITRVTGDDQIICSMPTRLNAYDPETGKLLWTCDGIRGPKGDLAYSSPMTEGDLCVVIGGFGGPGMGLKLGGSGNITAEKRLWRTEKTPQSIGSGVMRDGFVYRVNAARPAPVQCLEAATGKIVWNADPKGGICWGSLVTTKNGLGYVTNQRGTTLVFKLTPDGYEEVARNDLGEPSNSTPAISDGEIFIRTFEHLYCIGTTKQ